MLSSSVSLHGEVAAGIRQDNERSQEKIRSLSSYLLRRERLPANAHQNSEIRLELEKRRGTRNNPDLQEGQRMTVTFHDATYKAYSIECKGHALPLTLKLESKAVRVVVCLSKQFKQPTEANCDIKYGIQGVRLITLKEYLEGCEKMHLALTIKPQDKGLMSIVSLECYFNHRIQRSKSDSSRINFKSNKEKAARMKELDVFLEENKHMAKEIIAERQARSRQNFVAFNIRQISGKRLQSPGGRSYHSESKSEQQQLDKSRIILFEKEKHSYISHISKMNTQFPEMLRESRKRFQAEQAKRVRNMAAFIELNKFMKHIAKQSDLFSQKLYRKRRIEVHCRVFIRTLKNKTRRKLLFGTKVKLSIRLSAMLSVRMALDASQKKSRRMLCDIFDAMLMENHRKNILSTGSLYLQHIVRLQKYMKQRIALRATCFEQMQIKVGIENNIDRYEQVLKSRPKQRALKKKYMKVCIKKMQQQAKEQGRTERPILGFFRQQNILGQLMLKLLEPPKSPRKQ